MDLSKLSKINLQSMCKEREIKGYSKLKKEDLITMLVKHGVENTPDIPDTKESSLKKPREVKPRMEKLSKKLEKSLSVDDYKTELDKLTEESEDKDILVLIQDKVDEFITSEELTAADFKKYVDEYGVMDALVEYLVIQPKVSKLTADEIYNKLAVFLYKKDTSIADSLIKKFRKCIAAMIKAEKTANAAKAAALEKEEKSAKVVKAKPKAPAKKPQEDDLSEESESDSDAEEESDSDNE
jgi:hypothetical protein